MTTALSTPDQLREQLQRVETQQRSAAESRSRLLDRLQSELATLAVLGPAAVIDPERAENLMADFAGVARLHGALEVKRRDLQRRLAETENVRAAAIEDMPVGARAALVGLSLLPGGRNE